jgi:hypothetical protein
VRPDGQRCWWLPLQPVLLALWLTLALADSLLLLPGGASAAPGLCVGPVCADTFSRSERYSWQLRMRVQDQAGHRERLLVDCRDGAISPMEGVVERGYTAALGRRACRMAPLSATRPRSGVAPSLGPQATFNRRPWPAGTPEGVAAPSGDLPA